MNIRVIIEETAPVPEGTYIAVKAVEQDGDVADLLRWFETYMLRSLAEMHVLTTKPYVLRSER